MKKEQWLIFDSWLQSVTQLCPLHWGTCVSPASSATPYGILGPKDELCGDGADLRFCFYIFGHVGDWFADMPTGGWSVALGYGSVAPPATPGYDVRLYFGACGGGGGVGESVGVVVVVVVVGGGVNFPDVGHGCHEHLLGGLCSQVACIQYWWSLLDDRLPVPRPPAQRSHDLDLRAVLAPSSEARACCAAVDCNRAEEKKLCRASAFGAGGPQGGPWRLGGHASPLPAWSCARPCGFL